MVYDFTDANIILGPVRSLYVNTNMSPLFLKPWPSPLEKTNGWRRRPFCVSRQNVQGNASGCRFINFGDNNLVTVGSMEVAIE